MGMSRFEALLRFIEWYAGCLRYSFEHSLKNCDYGFIDSTEEILLNEAMTMVHSKKWSGENWVKAHEDYKPKTDSNQYMKRC